ncbi:MAG: PDZ domain-containing protein [Verrucomicrobia bacterium]|nr:PDZ domain-containing protein [Verrucomicrobiota bacterium]
MKSLKKNSFVSTLGCAASLTFALVGPSAAQNPSEFDLEKAFEQQMERLSRLLPDDPEAREQFNKGMAEMQKAFEDDAANPSRNSQPKTFEFRWESDDPGDLSDLRKQLERLGGFGGSPGGLLERFFFGRGMDPFGDSLGNGLGVPPHQLRGMHGFSIEDLFGIEQSAPPELSKNHPEELNKFKSVVEAARPSTVRILSGGNQLVMGTIVTENGYALTKRSELGRTPGLFEAQLSTGGTVSARFVEEIADFDLALIKLDAKGLQPAQFSDSAALPLGSFLAAPDVIGEPVAAGILSVQARNLSPKSKGYLGIVVEKRPNDVGVSVTHVTPDSAAAAAGLRPNDIITEVDGKPVGSPPQLIKIVSGQEPDAIVEINYVRDGQSATTSAKLKSRAELARLGWLDRSHMDLTSQMGADISSQNDGYPSALQHDAPLASNEMGGPLVDLDGKIVGINIARSGRVSTYALPAAELNKILAALELEKRPDEDTQQNDRLPEVVEATGNDALREEVERAEEAIEKARAALRAAEESAQAAREALKSKDPR